MRKFRRGRLSEMATDERAGLFSLLGKEKAVLDLIVGVARCSGKALGVDLALTGSCDVQSCARCGIRAKGC